MAQNPASPTIEAFCAVGRNVVNFQRLEMILKRLALFAPISTPLSRLENDLEILRAKSAQLTLGAAVKKWIESANHIGPQEHLQTGNDIILSAGFVHKWSPGKLEELSAELESLKEERNSLIHLDLAQVNFEDEAECRRLTVQLNAQNDRIIRTIESLKELGRRCRT